MVKQRSQPLRIDQPFLGIQNRLDEDVEGRSIHRELGTLGQHILHVENMSNGARGIRSTKQDIPGVGSTEVNVSMQDSVPYDRANLRVQPRTMPKEEFPRCI
jgi:hypothetical protein